MESLGPFSKMGSPTVFFFFLLLSTKLTGVDFLMFQNHCLSFNIGAMIFFLKISIEFLNFFFCTIKLLLAPNYMFIFMKRGLN